MDERLGRILSSPGLQFIMDDILLMLQPQDLAAAESTCHQWRDHARERFLWKWMLFKMAPRGSYHRMLLESRCFAFQAHIMDSHLNARNVTLVGRRLCHKLQRGLTKLWQYKQYKVKKVAQAKLVRYMIVGEDEIAYAVGCTINVAKRRLTWADLRSTYQLEHDRVLEGAHRQDVTVLSVDEDLLMASSKEKMISFWNWRTGTFLTHIKDAHNRLITGVKVKGDMAVSSSRDHLVKIWGLRWTRSSSDSTDTLEVFLGQTLEGHTHPVWAVDFNSVDPGSVDLCSKFLVSGSSDNIVRLWRKHDSTWDNLRNLKGHKSGVRNVCLLQCNPNYCLSGDLSGELCVWNLKQPSLQYRVPEQQESCWFRHSGGTVAISECAEASYIAVAFGNHRICLYLTHRVDKELEVARAIDLYDLIDPGVMRGVIAKPTELFLCSYTGQNGIIVLDVWDED